MNTFVTRYLVIFKEGEPPMTTTRPESRVYSTRSGAETRSKITTEWRANLIEVVALTEDDCLQVFQELK
jgi:hypothetical protein